MVCVWGHGVTFVDQISNAHSTNFRKKQESWLLPTEHASALKTRMNGLSCGEKNHDNTFSRFDTIPACDRRTERRT